MLNEIRMPVTRKRGPWLVAGVLLAGAVLVIPLLVFSPRPEPPAVAIAQVVLCGIILGVGRQGLDILALRMFASSLIILVGVTFTRQGHMLACTTALNCVQLTILTGLFLGVFGLLVLSVVAIPTTVIWNRSLGQLRPELHWPGLKWWQWLLVGLAGLPILGLLLGIPFPG